MGKTYKDSRDTDKFERVKNRSKKIKLKRENTNRKKKNSLDTEY